MSLHERPSPMAHPLQVTDLRTWGARRTQAEREAHKATVRAHALSAGHPSVYDHEAESALPTVAIAVSTLEASLIVTALRGSAFPPARDLGERLAADLRARTVVDTDPTPPRGTRRPGGAA